MDPNRLRNLERRLREMAAGAAEPNWRLDVGDGGVHVPFGPFQGITVNGSEDYCHDCAGFLEHLLNHVPDALDSLAPGARPLPPNAAFAFDDCYDTPASRTACEGCGALLEYRLTNDWALDNELEHFLSHGIRATLRDGDAQLEAYQVLRVLERIAEMESDFDRWGDELPPWLVDGRESLAEMAESWLDGVERKAAIQRNADASPSQSSPTLC